MNNKKSVFVAAGLLSILALGLVAAFPMGGFSRSNGGRLTNSDLSDLSDEEVSELRLQRAGQMLALREAVESGDFEAWEEIMNSRVSEFQAQITRENFEAMVARHAQMSEFHDVMVEARESGDFSKVEELKEELGFNFGNNYDGGEGFGMRKGQGRGMHGGMSGDCPFAE